ncbi:GspE/PulE family protein [Methylobacterium sp. HMF5984]|uniref:GspE/PulE family protein n=1 Tax=Methylobacterium sp. HMF5984 TaxID=3367370 RepID=UPI003853C12C
MGEEIRLESAADLSLTDFLRMRGLPVAAVGAVTAQAIWRQGDIGAEELADAVAAFHCVPRASRDAVVDLPALTKGLSRRFLQETFLYPVRTAEGALVLTADPTQAEPIEAVRLALDERAALAVLSFEEIADLLTRDDTADHPLHGEVDLDGATDVGLFDDIETLQDLARGAPVVRAIDDLFTRALDAGATDIHIETAREELRIRFRIDGLLRLQQNMPRGMAPAVISRVKILAGLDIAERRLPQDGRTTIRVGSVEADLRVAVMPTLYGETAVLRILVQDAQILNFGRIGIAGRDRAALEAMLAEPHGVIIVTGPTGSGKTTTLATAISLLNDPARKIVTVEDPVEYQIPGIHQTQVKPAIGLTFASALRSFLRHDPDVIMVGEMRDRETASIGIQAALTGHLVLTTLHTNSACDAVVRLADMGIEPFLIASALRGVLGQRLVRRLCARCRISDERGAGLLREICARRGIAPPERLHLHAPVGCPSCGGTGYRGRVGLFEALPVDGAVRDLVRREPDPMRILEAARAGGMTTMLEDGIGKAAEGLISLEEVMRVAA